MNSDRLSYYFTTLCEIDSPSRGESKLSAYLHDLFIDLGADLVFEDNSMDSTGSDCGNLVVRFSGNRNDAAPVFFNCHLDVINPCLGVKVRKIDDFFYSSGDTVLGADDKAGIAILIEVLISLVQENKLFVPVELLFTTCEEIGLLGAKAFNPSLLFAKYGYALDSTGVDNVIIGAPASYGFTAEVHGLASHAGLRPQCGINAIQLASRAVSLLPLGQINENTTANVGLVAGGTATNIIPDYARVDGEVRSHNSEMLYSTLNNFKHIFQNTVSSWHDPNHSTSSRPRLAFSAFEQYPLMNLNSESLPGIRAQQAAIYSSRSLQFIQAGGGSDANILNAAGLQTAILGIGMENVHSVAERIKLSDMIRTADLVVSILTC
jgi:tripeptide aminopeptidase